MGVAIYRADSALERITYVVLAVSSFVFSAVLLAKFPESFRTGRQQLEAERIKNERELLRYQMTTNTVPMVAPAPVAPPDAVISRAGIPVNAAENPDLGRM